MGLYSMEERFEDTKGAIRSRKTKKNRQYNEGQRIVRRISE